MYDRNRLFGVLDHVSIVRIAGVVQRDRRRSNVFESLRRISLPSCIQDCRCYRGPVRIFQTAIHQQVLGATWRATTSSNPSHSSLLPHHSELRAPSSRRMSIRFSGTESRNVCGTGRSTWAPSLRAAGWWSKTNTFQANRPSERRAAATRMRARANPLSRGIYCRQRDVVPHCETLRAAAVGLNT